MKEDAKHLTPDCENSFRLSDGSVYSQRGRMTTPQWTAECQRVAEYLKIPIEQHQAMYSAIEYLAKDVPKPHRGLLAERMIYWLMIDFHPEASRAIGTLLASVYISQPDEKPISQPVIMYLRGFDVSFLAWAEVAKDLAEDDPARHDTWVKKAKWLLADWWSEIARDLHQLE